MTSNMPSILMIDDIIVEVDQDKDDLEQDDGNCDCDGYGDVKEEEKEDDGNCDCDGHGLYLLCLHFTFSLLFYLKGVILLLLSHWFTFPPTPHYFFTLSLCIWGFQKPSLSMLRFSFGRSVQVAL